MASSYSPAISYGIFSTKVMTIRKTSKAPNLIFTLIRSSSKYNRVSEASAASYELIYNEKNFHWVNAILSGCSRRIISLDACGPLPRQRIASSANQLTGQAGLVRLHGIHTIVLFNLHINGIILANDLSGGAGPVGGVSGSVGGGASSGGSAVGGTVGTNNTGQSQGQGSTTSSLTAASLNLEHQQFNIFPAIFSRQLNFSAAAANCGQSKLMDELRPNLGLLGVNLMENEAFHINHNQEKRKCNSASSNEQDFGIYGVHQSLETSPPTSTGTPGRNSVGAVTSVEYFGNYKDTVQIL
ncbi:hypothetical protein TSAR_013716 [Trichomalopsis sarcophagae]|uniref:Uncharacterized protein n=1 Tax=Trichomalopsis sarcophagae TaxID=543379 RepID=A0A232FB25_9HYME|nr:hypothetical protein TSAR_013716 [Trichomalopsis sarcophagae]